MKLQQLRFILAIKECGLNITQASQRLYTSQPGVSKQLRLLEEELGLEIFLRNGKALVGITDAGKVILEKAESIMNTAEEIKNYSKASTATHEHVSIAQFVNCA